MPVSSLKDLMVLNRPVFSSSFFCVGPQGTHVEEVADRSMGCVVPIATLVQEGASRSKSKTKD